MRGSQMAIAASQTDMEDVGFKKGLALNVCVRCQRLHGTEEERSDFVTFAKESDGFYCPDAVGDEFHGKVMTNSHKPPEWCPYLAEHAVSRKP